MTSHHTFVVDTETASLEGGVCDIAIVKLDEDLNIIWSAESLIDPERPIKPEASGIHHITDEMVWDKPTLSEFMEMHGFPLNVEPGQLVVAGHNVQFDCRMISEHLPVSYRKLCTLKLARNLWPEAEDHKLQTLRYKFKLGAGSAHRAMGDVITCTSLLKMIAHIKGLNLSGLIELAHQPLSLESRMPFGKHKSEKLKDIPISYVRWLLGNAEIDPDLREALAVRIN